MLTERVRMASDVINSPMDSNEFCRLIQQTKGMTGYDMEEWLSSLTNEQLRGIKKCAGHLFNFTTKALLNR
ncbi:MAG: hypothetical protein E6230_02725 [Paenibacillus dendritiformis]|uniref:hypothetical protein n=1 Tax=uncultured Paenibacillus sp. TaxID=227322 RepID=UPI0025F0FA74|nr:hypothetical protein [uncultured Paenibacillus sp.]MDU5141088.1 hypothetical protein [Paenibacillus dendritiformis]